jgi:SSS family solute:Na+ symporter/cation/acetate symporter
MNFASAGTETTIFTSFILFMCLCLLLCTWSAPDSDDAAEFYTARRTLGPVSNGLAISGDYITVVTLLGTTTVIATTGYDGILLACGTAVSLLLVMVLVAEPLRNLGGYTLGEAISRRMPGRRARLAMALGTLMVCLPFLVVQLSAVSTLLSYLLGFDSRGAATVCVVVVGILMISYAALGGMRGTGLIQIVKIVVLLATVPILATMTLARLHWNFSALLAAAAKGSGQGSSFLHPGLEFGGGALGRLDDFSFLIAVLLGAACTPHVTMRLFASRDARQARRSMRWAVVITTTVCSLVVVLGLGIAALVGTSAIRAADPSGLSGVLLLSQNLGGQSGALVALAACAIFATQLAAVAGVTLAAGSALAHDMLSRTRLWQPSPERREVATARLGILGIGVPGIALAILAQRWNVIAIVGLGVTLGASTIVPILIYTFTWRGFTGTGLLWCLYGGAGAVLLLTLFSPAVSGMPTSLFPHHDLRWFPLQNPGIVTIPLGFALGWAGSKAGHRALPEEHHTFEVRILTGVTPE